MVSAVLRCSALLFTVLVPVQSDALVNITAHFGQNVTLPCRAPSSAPIRAAEWTRPDLESYYVFLYRNKQPDKTHQHPSFKDRVELADSQIKDGNLSLILRDVNRNDTGTYECRVNQVTERVIRAVIISDPISVVHLLVTEPRDTAGNSGNGQHVVGLLLCLHVMTVTLYLLVLPY